MVAPGRARAGQTRPPGGVGQQAIQVARKAGRNAAQGKGAAMPACQRLKALRSSLNHSCRKALALSDRAITMPMSAAYSAGASLTPSPVIATPWASACSAATLRSLCAGATRAKSAILRTAAARPAASSASSAHQADQHQALLQRMGLRRGRGRGGGFVGGRRALAVQQRPVGHRQGAQRVVGQRAGCGQQARALGFIQRQILPALAHLAAAGRQASTRPAARRRWPPAAATSMVGFRGCSWWQHDARQGAGGLWASEPRRCGSAQTSWLRPGRLAH